MAIESGGRAPRARNWNGEAVNNSNIQMPHFLLYDYGHWLAKYYQIFKKMPNVSWANEPYLNSVRVWGQAKRLWENGHLGILLGVFFQIHTWGSVPEVFSFIEFKS